MCRAHHAGFDGIPQAAHQARRFGVSMDRITSASVIAELK
jgi:hypothetical protein